MYPPRDPDPTPPAINPEERGGMRRLMIACGLVPLRDMTPEEVEFHVRDVLAKAASLTPRFRRPASRPQLG